MNPRRTSTASSRYRLSRTLTHTHTRPHYRTRTTAHAHAHAHAPSFANQKTIADIGGRQEYDLTGGEPHCLRTFKGTKSSVRAIQFDQGKLVAGDFDSRIKVPSTHTTRVWPRAVWRCTAFLTYDAQTIVLS